MSIPPSGHHSNTPPNGGGSGGWNWRQFAYDDFGRMVYRARGGMIPNAGPWKREVDLKWDSQGRLREARDRSAGNRQLLSATYTADGERITKSDPITGAHLNSYGLHDTNRNTVYTPGVGFRAAGTDRFHHADRLGSTRALTDGAGRVDTVKSKARYSAFGQTQFQGPDGDQPTEHQFAAAWGYEREPSAKGLGLDYLYQRYYDPAIGRFISADPIGLAGGPNLYGYCAGDPVNAVDPNGEDPEDADDFPGTNPRRLYRKMFNQGARQLTSARRFQPGSPERGAYAWVMQVITGPVGVVYGAVSGFTGSDPIAGARLSGGQRFLAVATAAMAVVGKATGLGCVKQPVPSSNQLLWRVGSSGELRKLIPKGSQLEVHHLPSRYLGLHPR